MITELLMNDNILTLLRIPVVSGMNREPYEQKEIIFIGEESREGGYEAHALNHSIYTETDTLPPSEKDD